MSLRTFRAALKHNTGQVTLGGGEPTLHRDFERMLLEAMAHPYMEADCGGVLVITNGSHKRRARMLFQLAKSGGIHAELSRDDYHDEVDEETAEMWETEAARVDKSHRSWNHCEISRVGIRNTTECREPIANGRARTELGYEKDENYTCPCDGIVVKPNGDVYACGCDDSPKIGDVFNGFTPPEDEEYLNSGCAGSRTESCKV
jgi:MoaA/NifB/PqqE/SkfB family radical SAM enzyme